MSLLCRIGLHRWDVWWPNVAPTSGGGPRFIEETCERCGYSKTVRNWR